MSQNNTSSNPFELIVTSLLFFVIGSAITCHLMKNRYPPPQPVQNTVVDRSIENYKFDDVSKKIESLEKLISDKAKLDDKIKILESQNQEILKALADLNSSKKEAVVVNAPQPTASIDYSKIANMVNSQNQAQNSKIIDLSSKIDSLEIKIKEYVSNSWVNDQKLNEIKSLLSQKQNTQPVVNKNIETPKPENQQPRLIKKYVDAVETKPVPRTLSVRSDLPADYQTPKKVYKVDELK